MKSTTEFIPKELEEGIRPHRCAIPLSIERSWLWKCVLYLNLALSLWTISLLTRQVLSDVGCVFFGQWCEAKATYERSGYLVKARNGAVASENERCSVIGVQVLKDGGNAVDAAISASLCTGVVNMFSSGIGGGGFMVVRIPPLSPGKDSEVYAIDFREAAPGLANTTMFRGDPRSARFGGLSVAVPSELRGFEEAHRRWGKLPWKRLVEPSVELARGWTVDKELGRRIPWFADLMLHEPDWRSIFAPRGVFLSEGEVIRRTNYSRTLGIIAEEGVEAFYNGGIGESIVRKVQSTGGILTRADLANYQVKVSRALKGTYRNRTVYTNYAPSSGPVLLHMLNLMEKYELVREGMTGLNVHRAVEAMKFGFAARTKISDPDFEENTTRIDEIPRKEFAEMVGKGLTDDRTHEPEYYKPVFGVEVDHGTSHTSSVDKEGMAVSVTSTVNQIFGSQVMDGETGVILNDEMDDFSIPGVANGWGLLPSPYNFPEGGKRALSSMTPIIMEEDGELYGVIGGAGGSQIVSSVFQVVLNLEFGLDVREAVEHGRVHDQLYPMEVEIDDRYPSEMVEWLKGVGHNTSVLDVGRVAGVVQAIVKRGSIYAYSDSRKNGIASGY